MITSFGTAVAVTRATLAGLRTKTPGGPERWQRTNYAGRTVELYAAPPPPSERRSRPRASTGAPGPRSWPPGRAARTTTWSGRGTPAGGSGRIWGR